MTTVTMLPKNIDKLYFGFIFLYKMFFIKLKYLIFEKFLITLCAYFYYLKLKGFPFAYFCISNTSFIHSFPSSKS